MNENTDKEKKLKNKIKNQHKITGLDIDKSEYQQIVLSQTNHPHESFTKKKKYFD